MGAIKAKLSISCRKGRIKKMLKTRLKMILYALILNFEIFGSQGNVN